MNHEYKLKVATVRAIQWTGTNFDDVRVLFATAIQDKLYPDHIIFMEYEADFIVTPGLWIVDHPSVGKIAMTDEEFNVFYEPVTP